jgi:uncharacterized protein
VKLPRHILILLVRVYQWTLSPLLATLSGPAGRCRFTPSCSQYAVEALKTHGALRGGALAAGRLCRCNPWGSFGDDPVPAKFKFSLRQPPVSTGEVRLSHES